MKNAALVLADEFEEIMNTGNITGETLVQQRMNAHEYSSPTEYFTFLVEHAVQIPRMLDRVKTAGEWHRGFGTLKEECMDIIFMFQSGWGGTLQIGRARVALHTVHNLESLGRTFNSLFRDRPLGEAERTKIRLEIQAVRQFVEENSEPGPNQTFILSSIDYILGILDDDIVDHALLSSEIASLLGLITMFATSLVPEEERGKWFDRIRSGALVLGTNLLVSSISDMGSIGVQKLLGLT